MLTELRAKVRRALKTARQRAVNWLLDDVTISGVRLQDVRSGENTIRLSPNVSGIKDIFRWTGSQAALALGDLGMDVSTGRPSFFVSGSARAAAHTNELVTTLDGLSDVTVSGAARQQTIRYNPTSSQWVNVKDTNLFIVDPADPTCYSTIASAVAAAEALTPSNFNPAVYLIRGNVTGSSPFTPYVENITLTRPCVMMADFGASTGRMGPWIIGQITITPAAASRVFQFRGIKIWQDGSNGSNSSCLVVNAGSGTPTVLADNCYFFNSRTATAQSCINWNAVSGFYRFESCVLQGVWTTGPNALFRETAAISAGVYFYDCELVVGNGLIPGSASDADHRVYEVNAANQNTRFIQCLLIGKFYTNTALAAIQVLGGEWYAHQNDAHLEFGSSATGSGARLGGGVALSNMSKTAYTRTEWIIRGGSVVPRLYIGLVHYDDEVNSLNSTALGYLDVNPKDAGAAQSTVYNGRDESFATFLRDFDQWIDPTAPTNTQILQYATTPTPKRWKAVNPNTVGNQVTTYLVSKQTGASLYTTIQSAINAAVSAGGRSLVVVGPGEWAESLSWTGGQITLVGYDFFVRRQNPTSSDSYDQTRIQGLSWTASTGTNETLHVAGIHIQSTSGNAILIDGASTASINPQVFLKDVSIYHSADAHAILLQNISGAGSNLHLDNVDVLHTHSTGSWTCFSHTQTNCTVWAQDCRFENSAAGNAVSCSAVATFERCFFSSASVDGLEIAGTTVICTECRMEGTTGVELSGTATAYLHGCRIRSTSTGGRCVSLVTAGDVLYATHNHFNVDATGYAIRSTVASAINHGASTFEDGDQIGDTANATITAIDVPTIV